MTTNGELTRLAAKAAGFNGTVTEYENGYVEMGLSNHFNPNGGNVWNPLRIDGDALRLVVKLGLLLDCRYTDPILMKYNKVTYWVDPSKSTELYFDDVELDFYAATRRAIVRAAAEIGKSIK